MRRYLSLLPLLMLTIVISDFSLPSVQAQECVYRNWTLDDLTGATFSTRVHRQYDFTLGDPKIYDIPDPFPWPGYGTIVSDYRAITGRVAGLSIQFQFGLMDASNTPLHTSPTLNLTASYNVSNGSTVGGYDYMLAPDPQVISPVRFFFDRQSGANVMFIAQMQVQLCKGEELPPPPPRVFRRPLEFPDVDTTFDWFDSNGTRTLTHCVSAKVRLAGEHLTAPVPPGYYSTPSSTGGTGGTTAITCSQPGGGLQPEIDRIAIGATENVAYQTSVDAFKPVHAIEGMVIERRKITPTDCFDMTIAETDAVEGPAEPYPPASLPSTCVFEIPSWANVLDERSMFLRSQTDNIYLVRVRFEYGEMRYLVTNPRVEQGQHIRDGCIIGETIPISGWYDPSIHSSWFSRLIEALDSNNWIDQGEYYFIRQATSRRVNDAPKGITLMGYVSSVVDPPVQDYLYGPYSQITLSDYSSPANSCDISPNFANCKSTNPLFLNEGEYWLSHDPLLPPLWTNPGVILEPGDRIYLPNMPLDGEEYGASIQVEQMLFNPLAGGRVRVGIGQSSYVLTTSMPVTQTLKIEPISHVPNNGILYDVSIENVGSADIKVHYFCLTEGEAQTVKVCLFDNYSFDLGLSGWDTNGASVSALPGSIGLEHSEWIKQAITLNPTADGPHTYEIELDAVFSAAGGQIAMQWGSESAGGGFAAPGALSPRTITGTLTVTSGATQEFQITAYVPDQTGPPTSGSVMITRVCINGPYPGQGGGGVEFQPPEGCGQIAFPGGGDVQAVLQWHWHQIDQFNRCTFMPKLHEFYKAVQKGFNDLADQFKFWRQVLYSFSAWLDTQFFPWLAGYMANITPGTVIVEGGGGCHDIFCLLTSLIESILRPIVDLVVGLVQQAADLLFTVMTGLIVLFIKLLTQVLMLVQMASQIVVGLIQGYIDAEPIPIPGLPNCNTTPTEGICVVWWIADHTILSGPGAAIIPLFVSILYILFGLYVVKEIKRIIISAGNAL